MVAQQVVEAAVPLLGLALVSLDPFGHQVEDLRFEMHGTALRVTAARHEPGVLEHPQVLRDRLHRDLVRLGQLVDGRIGDREPGDHVAPGRIRQCREHPRERVCRHGHLPCSTIRLITGCRASRALSTLRLNTVSCALDGLQSRRLHTRARWQEKPPHRTRPPTSIEKRTKMPSCDANSGALQSHAPHVDGWSSRGWRGILARHDDIHRRLVTADRVAIAQMCRSGYSTGTSSPVMFACPSGGTRSSLKSAASKAAVASIRSRCLSSMSSWCKSRNTALGAVALANACTRRILSIDARDVYEVGNPPLIPVRFVLCCRKVDLRRLLQLLPRDRGLRSPMPSHPKRF